MIGLLLIAAAAQAAPSAEAEELGLRLARTGTLATIAPMLASKDAEDLVAAHPELSAVDRDALRATARKVAAADIEMLGERFGHAYAARLSVADLRVLVQAAESPAAMRFRSALPGAMAGAMQSAGAIDFKRDAIAAFCRETGKACPSEPAH